MTADVKEVHWSDLQKDPKGVAELADSGQVRVIRRDGVNLVLMREDRVVAASAGAVIAARAFRHIIEGVQDTSIGKSMAEEFPWLTVLPEDDLHEFVHDFVKATLAAAELARWEIIDQLIQEWKATASIHADPALALELTTPIDDDFGPVPSPAGDN
ncbi:MAG: hypothetical protein QOE61_3137 [Micromonosporaceae bacterium]|jgi:hypothetical protein|nr:hypothetical protein [Micromonosporaceae bacterium]